MSTKPESSELVLLSVAMGDLTETDPRVRELLSERPELRDRLAELRDLRARVEAGALFEREVVRDAEQRQDAPGLDRVREVLEREFRARQAALARSSAPTAVARETGSPASDRPRRRLGWAIGLGAAAIALVIAVLAVWPRPEDLRTEEIVLDGADEFTNMKPAGHVPRAESFHWRFPLPGDGTYRVEVEAAGGWTSRSPRLIEPLWPLDEEKLSTWPSRIRWRVIAYDGAGAWLGESDWQEWDRSSR